MPWETRLILLRYLFYCGGLEQNAQYHKGMPENANKSFHKPRVEAGALWV